MPGPHLVFLTLGAIALLLVLILALRLHAFLALILTSFALGLACGMEPAKLLKSIQNGFGEALGFIAVVVALGAMIGRYLEHSGGGRALAEWMLARFGPRHAVWAVLISAFLVGLPIFFEVGFIIMLPLVLSLTRASGRTVLYFGLPVACALTVTHAMVPPHPAPAAAAQLLGADLGLTILYGIAVSAPMTLAGVAFASWVSKRIYVAPPERPAAAVETAQNPPHPGVVALLLLLPALLIFAATMGPRDSRVLTLLGHPFTALTLATLLAMYFFGSRRGLDRSQLLKHATDSLAPMGSLLAIMGGGGAFKQVIIDTGAGGYAGKWLAESQFSPLLLAYLVSVGMRVAQGSATVAIITAAGIIGPLVKGIPGYGPEWIVLAVCAGGTSLSHVNDAGFWLVNESLGLKVPETLRSWTVMKVITSFVGLAVILAAYAVLH